MPVNDRKDLGQISTIPDNLLQRPRFGAITEVTKDAFVTELRHFFSTQNNRLRNGELPRIDKYAVSVDPVSDPLATAVSVVRSFPDIAENLPTIAVLAATGKNLKLDLGDKSIGKVIRAAAITSSSAGPYVLADGQTMVIRTYPLGPDEYFDSTYTFRDFMFADITVATPAEVVAAINAQAEFATAYIGSNGGVAIRAGRMYEALHFPNEITVQSGTAVTPLGFSVAQTSSNTGGSNVMYSRYHMAADLTISVEILAESENIRTEISDLLYDFMSYVMADRKWQFYGRSIFDSSVLDEYYQIIIRDGEMTFSGESDMARPNDQKDKIYVNRITIPVTSILYSDRILVDRNGSPLVPQKRPDLQYREDLPPWN